MASKLSETNPMLVDFIELSYLSSGVLHFGFWMCIDLEANSKRIW